MKKGFKKFCSIALVAAMAASTLAGCGGSKSETAESSASSGAASESTTAGSGDTQAAATGGDGVLDIGYSSLVESLTPFRGNTLRNAPFMTQLYESLAVVNEIREMEPLVAKSWKTDDDGFTYNIEIWDRVSDSAGNKIDASDIVWFMQESMKRALKPVFAKVESVEQTGDYTLTVKMKSNIVGTFESLLRDTYAISKKAFESSPDEFGASLVSTSPYMITEYTANSILTLESRSDYWQDEANMPKCVRPNVKKLSYHCITESSQMAIALETGIVDMVIALDPSSAKQFVDNKDYTVELADGSQGYQIFFSGADNSEVADNVKLRQAICYSIDENGMITGLLQGYGTPMYDVCPPMFNGFNQKWLEEDYYNYNVEKAKQLVAESGYNGETITVLGTSNTMTQRMAQMLQSYMMAIGIKVELKLVDMALYTSIRLDGTQYDIVINTIGGTFLSDHWSIRYDPAAYKTGDATSRHDNTLAQLLYKTWTPSGYTEENIDAVHNYLKDSAIAYGMFNPQTICVIRKDTGLEKEVLEYQGYIAPASSTFNNY
ncbi:ABC transporter substrate-binding protein [Clostridium boliviensis]|uniref:ABC transporter substrate-binding protein n=1 Tax=Clostridium boliviensis TaxID=318465 RepID=A0ABU4GGH0_9CLOT|nr:ABC transporter substrate-binding protein [Clostridium boliviensis]MDW2796716.1 ABC transporter substrate-binding protein [Clostridium boliviensis]